LESDLFVAFNKVIDHEDPELVWDNQVCLGVVLASEGYPGSYEKMHAINGLEKVTGKVYAMGVKIVDGQTYNNGGRVLIIVEKADTVAKAREKALDDIKKIESDNLFYRSDIGHWAL
jgi:phosphoribosylamine--glycine ligase